MLKLAPALVSFVLAIAAPAAAQAPSTSAVALLQGSWELTSQGGARKCRLMLRPDMAKGRRLVGYPVACRRSLPVLGRVVAWSVSDDGYVILLDAEGKPVLAFEDDAAALKLKAQADGVDYQLDSMGRSRRYVARAATPPAPRVPFDPTRGPPRESIPGIYAMLRQGGQEVCRVQLSTDPGAAEGRFLTRHPARCRDKGLQVFDLVAWRYTGWRIHLIARRGHEMSLVPAGEGEWRKEPAGSADLSLRKVQP
ncbi:MAG: AprI/Inh family metalloprotease inhibitor [Bosea sp.]|jgi:hypothetical protein|nr:AprI/Inh family metalloprotease inhibitor [Bosea sp. (in: a-proteobacteria)]